MSAFYEMMNAFASYRFISILQVQDPCWSRIGKAEPVKKKTAFNPNSSMCQLTRNHSLLLEVNTTPVFFFLFLSFQRLNEGSLHPFFLCTLTYPCCYWACNRMLWEFFKEEKSKGMLWAPNDLLNFRVFICIYDTLFLASLTTTASNCSKWEKNGPGLHLHCNLKCDCSVGWRYSIYF